VWFESAQLTIWGLAMGRVRDFRGMFDQVIAWVMAGERKRFQGLRQRWQALRVISTCHLWASPHFARNYAATPRIGRNLIPFRFSSLVVEW
jgi:hypothetical protein